MSLIDTFHIATMGQNSVNTFTLASNGILIFVTIEPEPTPTPSPELDRPVFGGFLRNGLARNVRKRVREKREENLRKENNEDDCIKQKITVVAIIDNKEYKETITVECKPDLTVDDIDIQITETEIKPKITITLKN